MPLTTRLLVAALAFATLSLSPLESFAGPLQDVGLASSTSSQNMGALPDTAHLLQQASQHRCCNTKGAIIGAAAGAALGWWLVRSACDSSTCTSEYLKTIAVLGGLGATFGAFADVTHGLPGSLPERRVRVAGTVTPRLKACIVSVRF
jgi:hypothetical protein